MFPGPKDPQCLAFRLLIESCSVPEDPNLPPHKKFFPKNALVELCDRRKIVETLRCCCAVCDRHRLSIAEQESPERAADLIIGDGDRHTQEKAPLLLTFCLLVYIKCPQIIAFFLRKKAQFNDEAIDRHLADFDINYIRSRIWPEFDNDEPQESHKLASEFRWTKYKFFLPHMKDEFYVEFDESTLLPFIDEKPIGRFNEDGDFVQDQGGFGKVFSFNIHQEYHLFQNLPHTTRYARKEIFSTTPMRFHAERKNLELIKKLEDPHLVRIIKSYKHGGTFNLIFPCAQTNLGVYLREESFGATLEGDGKIERSPLWNQLLGIANALKKIINYRPSQPLAEEVSLYGYHCDLKPANILVYDPGTFVITDFGQARFKKTGGTSRITPFGGTEQYAPPEIDSQDPRYNRKYDVWSLGCIFLELVTFLLLGPDGVRQLDSVRSTRTTTNIEDDRFFLKNSGMMGYAVKPEVQEWMRCLPDHCKGGERTNDFLSEILSLITRMLEVDVVKRAKSEEVHQILSGILSRYQPALSQSPPEFNTSVSFAPDDVELGKAVLPNIETMMYYTDGEWKKGPVRIIEEPSHDLKILTTAGSQQLRLQLGTRGQAKLIPRYASHNKQHPDYADCNLYFSLGNSSKITFQSTKLFFRDLTEAVLVQSVILGQDIRQSLDLTRFVYERLPPISHRLTQLLSAQRAVAPVICGKGTIQLWSEKSFRERSAHTRQDSRRSVRRQPFTEPIRRRIVVYQEASIIIVRFSTDVRIERPSSTSTSPVLRIVPHSSSFVASLLSPSKHEVATGLPFSKEQLDIEEERGKFECRSLELNFETKSHGKEFFNAYKAMKDEWNAEEREINRCKKDQGEVFGYGLD